HVDRLSEEAVKRERLVEAARHKAFDDEFPDARCRYALHDERVQIFERTENAETQLATFGGGRIDVRKGREIFFEKSVAANGNGMARRGVRHTAAKDHKSKCSDERKFPELHLGT